MKDQEADEEPISNGRKRAPGMVPDSKVETTPRPKPQPWHRHFSPPACVARRRAAWLCTTAGSQSRRPQGLFFGRCPLRGEAETRAENRTCMLRSPHTLHSAVAYEDGEDRYGMRSSSEPHNGEFLSWGAEWLCAKMQKGPAADFPAPGRPTRATRACGSAVSPLDNAGRSRAHRINIHATRRQQASGSSERPGLDVAALREPHAGRPWLRTAGWSMPSPTKDNPKLPGPTPASSPSLDGHFPIRSV